MRKLYLLLILLCAFGSSSFGQAAPYQYSTIPSLRHFKGSPNDPCQLPNVAVDDTSGTLYGCNGATSTWTASKGGTAGAPNQNAIYISTSCGSQTNCFPVKAGVQMVSDATWTNSGTTITTGSSDVAFTSADVGKIEFGSSNCGAGNGNMNCFLQVPQGKIVTVTDAHNAVVSLAATATSSGGAGWFLWGTQDDAASIQAAYAALQAGGGGDLYLPCSPMFIESAPFITTAIHPFAINIHGCGSAMLIPTPSFNYASCGGSRAAGLQKGCIFADWYTNEFGTTQAGYEMDHLQDLLVFGGGVDGAAISGASQVAGVVGQNLIIDNVQLVGWNWNIQNNIAHGNTFDSCGFDVSSSSLRDSTSWTFAACGIAIEPMNTTDLATIIIGGQYGPTGKGPGLAIHTGDVCNGIDCSTFSYGSEFYSQLVGTAPPSNVSGAVLTTGIWHSFGDYVGGLDVVGGTAYLEGLNTYLIGYSGFKQTAGSVIAHNSNLYNVTLAGGTFTDQGGNRQGSLQSVSGPTAYKVANLPAGGTAGPGLAFATDSKAGSCTSGGGTTLTSCVWDGTRWVPSNSSVPRITPTNNDAVILGNGASSTTATTAAMPASTVAGNTLIAWVGMGGTTADLAGCTDTNGDTFAIAAQAGTSPVIGIAYASNIAAGASNAVTCTASTSHNFFSVYVAEFSGILATSPVDVTNSGTASAATSVSVSLTTSAANELIVAGTNFSSGHSFATQGVNFASTSWNAMQTVGNEYKFAAGAGATTASLSWTGSNNAQILAVAFKPAATLQVSSGFGTGAAVSAGTSPTAFRVNVGTSNTGTGVIALPTAATGWNCYATDVTTRSTAVSQTLATSTATAVTLQNYTDVMATGAWVDSDVIAVSCSPL